MNDYYSIIMGGKYLQGIEPNATYCPMSKAPTMGRRHDTSEFSTVWGPEPKRFERMTVANYIRTLLDEFRWGSLPPQPFRVVPAEEDQLRKSYLCNRMACKSCSYPTCQHTFSREFALYQIDDSRRNFEHIGEMLVEKEGI